MTTYRIKHSNRFTTISNEALQDSRLSFRARGIHHLLLSYPEDWQVREAHLVKQSAKEGRDSIRTAIKELIDLGYIRRYQPKISGGQYGETVFDVFETPEDIDSEPSPENPSPVHPSPVHPSPDNPLLLNTKETKYLTNKSAGDGKSVSETSVAVKSENEIFEELVEKFWGVAIKKKGKGRIRRALRAALKKISFEQLIKVWEKVNLDQYKRMKAEERYQFIPEPATWLNDERWEDADFAEAEPEFQEYTNENGYIITATGYRIPGRDDIEYTGRPPATPIGHASVEKPASESEPSFEEGSILPNGMRVGSCPALDILEKAKAHRAAKLAKLQQEGSEYVPGQG